MTQSPEPSLVALQVYEHEAAYVIVALSEAKRAAELQQRQWSDAGNAQQAAIFTAKAAALSAVLTRITHALTTK
jgi:hypothetical protein